MSIRILMLDLGETLIRQGQVLPHVTEALQALSNLDTVDGDPLAICLVSDFNMASPPVTSAKVKVLFKKYLALLDGFGLRSFFEPVNRRVTLSTHAGVNKPGRRLFELAIQRLGMVAPLSDCLFITEATAHLSAAAALGMATIPFDSADGFKDWADAPLLVAKKIAE